PVISFERRGRSPAERSVAWGPAAAWSVARWTSVAWSVAGWSIAVWSISLGRFGRWSAFLRALTIERRPLLETRALLISRDLVFLARIYVRTAVLLGGLPPPRL